MSSTGRFVGVAVVAVAIVAAVYWARSGDGQGQQSAAASAPALLGACDSQPAPPALPEALVPATQDLPGVIQALDAALNDAHKNWLRCFVLDDELVGRTQHGFGRWLRAELRLSRPSPLRTALRAKSPDDASALIVIAYVHHLRGDALTVDQASSRLTDALAVIGVSR